MRKLSRVIVEFAHKSAEDVTLARAPRDLSCLRAIIHALTRGDAMQAFRTEINFAIKICGTRKKNFYGLFLSRRGPEPQTTRLSRQYDRESRAIVKLDVYHRYLNREREREEPKASGRWRQGKSMQRQREKRRGGEDTCQYPRTFTSNYSV